MDNHSESLLQLEASMLTTSTTSFPTSVYSEAPTTMTMSMTTPPGSSRSSVAMISPSPVANADKHKNDFRMLRSFVMMDDDGAELVAEFDSLSVSTESSCKTPKKALRSLLDDEHSSCYTPTPPAKMMEKRTPSSTETTLCCTGFKFLECSKDENGLVEVIKVQEKILSLLGDPFHLELLLKDWQMWTMFGATTSTHNIRREEVKKALRNRAFSIAERRRRMDSVRRELSPFSTTPIRQKRSPAKFGKVTSFDLSKHAPGMSRGSKQKNDNNGMSNFVSLWERAGCLCDTSSKGDSPAMIRSGMLNAVREEDVCYDSDPEDFTRRRSPKRKKNSSAVLHHSLLQEDDDDDDDDECNKENRYLTSRSLLIQQQNAGIDDDETLSQMIQEFMNERFTLILHEKGPADKASSPHAVKAWFERGQHLSCNSVIQPKFMWHRVRRNGFAIPASDVSNFCLVDVARVLAVETVDRKLYPFAKPPSCFLVKTLERTFLFETKSAAERQRFVRLMKLCVARLGSKLIVGDQSFFEEYFVTNMEHGPGDAPFFGA